MQGVHNKSKNIINCEINKWDYKFECNCYPFTTYGVDDLVQGCSNSSVLDN